MVRLKTLHCPRCGAEVELDAKHGEAKCAYCGTRSYAESGRPPEHTIVVKAHPSVWVALALVLSAIPLCAWVMKSDDAPAAPLPMRVVEERAIVEPKLATVRVTTTVQSYVPAQLVDADGDGKNELLLPIERNEDGTRSDHFALYQLPSGKLLRETSALAGPQSALVAVAYRRLLLARRDGQLEGYDLVSGDAQWSTVLGERVAALCEGPQDTIHVTTDDGRELEVDVQSGRQTRVRTRCKVPLAVAQGRHEPSDRRDYRAPRGVAAYLCGTVRVMGSQSYVVPDACLAHAKIDTDRLDGMVGHALWAFERGQLVFGVRTPGTYVPSVGLLERGKWVWKSEVPAANPLLAETGGPRLISLHGDSLLIAYKAAEKSWLTRFDARHGTRSWTRELGSTPVALLQDDSAVVAHLERSFLILTPDGE